MASLWLQSASLLVLLVMLCPENSSTQVIPQRLCGSHLIDALQFVCGSKGFYFSSRRDVLSSNENELKDQKGMVVKRTPVEDCCHKPCTLEMLERYCN